MAHRSTSLLLWSACLASVFALAGAAQARGDGHGLHHDAAPHAFGGCGGGGGGGVHVHHVGVHIHHFGGLPHPHAGCSEKGPPPGGDGH